jgi:CRP-like cAMP-binding protein
MDLSMTADALAGLSLFADLERPQLEAVAHIFTEEMFPAGARILRQGFSGTGFYIILDGEVAVRIDGEERARLAKGDFFGETSLLIGEPPFADVVALTPLRALHLGGPDLRGFLVAYPPVMYRMLQSVARRLRSVSRPTPSS